HSFFKMRRWMPEFNVTKILLDAAHDADAVYRYFLKEGITPFIDLNKVKWYNIVVTQVAFKI
ncbi:MAG: hypothetical protein II919_05540, partial [Lachnospiraceae bacterium]|nr:hypothetical protein [Lachnospiraceae bacterium]